ncbi:MULTISPECIES: hypothetical protein [Bacillaceae]|uniref:Uncharacterized protein n=1 Tax=Peribacillus huizhouensis TaxID=1501239 RepID=A0ABR6CKD3_9BACI|nr:MULTISPECIES: hypothetical protein [Bacillaceae]MBA9025480.1 hypothetical protein [Peribacillus huizhouensis]
MESLFDWIFGNIWVIAIIFGIISSMFSKKKATQRDPKSTGTPTTPINQKPVREQNLPKHDQSKTIRQFYEEAKKAMEPSRPDTLEIETDTKPNAEVWLKEQELKQQEAERKRQIQLKEDLAVRKEISDDSSPVYQTNFTISQQKVLDGIIMAEVLGPPRAKNRRRLGRRK